MTRLGVLTTRQREVMALVAEGYTDAEIAHAIGIAEHTVANHLREVYRTLGVSSRVAALRRLGYIRKPVTRHSVVAADQLEAGW